MRKTSPSAGMQPVSAVAADLQPADQDFGLDLNGLIFEDEDDFGVDFGMIFADTAGGRKTPHSEDGQEADVDVQPIDDLRFIDFDKFRCLKSLPRYPDNKSITVPLRDIDREHTFFVFVSHRWVPHPDHAGEIKTDDDLNTKLNLCVKGIDNIWRSQAPRMRRCFIWMDCGCIPQDNGNPGQHLHKLHLIMKYCDCVFTPLLDIRPDTWSSHPKLIQQEASARAKAWNNGPYAYLNRAWCRLEIMYASYIPVSLKSSMTKQDERKTRSARLASKLLAHHRLGHRPHFVYGTQESRRDRPPSLLQVLKKHTVCEKYDPRQGNVSVPIDMELITKLTTDILLTQEPSVTGYKGERNDAGEMHGFGTLIYENDDVYTGEFVHGLRCGHGSMKCASGNLYEGFFFNDLCHGRGTMQYSDGSAYEGEWKNGMREGKGKYLLANGDIYHGDFYNDKISGSGKLQFEKGASIYNGEFEDGDFHGEGTLQYANGNIYKGKFKHGKRHGMGLLKSANGNVYKGRWEDDERHGRGLLKTVKGDVYEGHFKHNEITGSGKYQFTTGDAYVGELKNGQMHGQGVYMYANGSVYEGEFRNGLSNGKGRFNFCSGDFYEGEWLDDHRHGQGLLRYKNGGEYFGEFVHNVKQGRGRFTYPNGEVFNGIFVAGKRTGVGTYEFSNGDVYDGQWKSDVIEGEGVMRYANGDVYEGYFDGGIAQGTGTCRYANGDCYRGDIVHGIPHGQGSMIYASGDTFEGEFRCGKKYGKGVYRYANGRTYNGYWKNDQKKHISIGIIKRTLLGR